MELLTLDQIQTELETTEITPSRAADLSVIVSSKYGRACDAYVKAHAIYAGEFNKNRDNFKSVTATENWLSVQPCGIERHKWKYTERKAKVILEALKTLVFVKTAEARSQI